MEMKERAYTALLVSAVEKFNSTLPAMVSEASINVVDIAQSVAAAKRLVADRSYDFVIINTPLPDEFGTQFAVDAGLSRGSVVLLFVRSEAYPQLMNSMTARGIHMLPKPTSAAMIRQGLDWLCATRERLRSMEQKTVSLSDKMNEIRLVNRAKWALINVRGFSETEAHRYIEKHAMDRCVSKRVIAEELLTAYDG